MNRNALYLGMADDIWTPLQFDYITTIYVIDNFDSYFAPSAPDSTPAGGRTIEHQREAIRRYITDGDNEVVFQNSPNHANEYYKRSKLQYRGVIKSDRVTDDGAWRLNFTYGNRDIKLVFFSGNFMSDEWPSEIRNIIHVFIIGAATWMDFIPNPENTPEETANFLRMMEERTIPGCLLTATLFLHEHFQTHQQLPDRYEGIQTIATNVIKRMPDGSIDVNRLLPIGYLKGKMGIDKYGDYVPIELVKDPNHNKKPTVADILNNRIVNC